MIGGHKDPDIEWLQTDAPTINRLTVLMLLQLVSSRRASHQRQAAAGDITAAFLNGDRLDRELFLAQLRDDFLNIKLDLEGREYHFTQNPRPGITGSELSLIVTEFAGRTPCLEAGLRLCSSVEASGRGCLELAGRSSTLARRLASTDLRLVTGRDLGTLREFAWRILWGQALSGCADSIDRSGTLCRERACLRQT